MSGGAEAMTAFAAKLRNLRRLATEAAKEAAPAVEAVVRASAAAGTTPDGQAWKPTKAGSRPLANAASAVSARAVGTVVEVIVRGHHFLHHMGLARGKVVRQIIPTHLTPELAAALRRATARAFARLMGGA